ncbi:hypothetical protein OXPF_17950 [Oxobacter pfennigii]|uniref:Uncharacterized protein n=1 Tax=Oxobacter pfennigii TaxID=36849 RepID=A0A0P8YY73_9CLOT|nr:hypothetical protein [Oxobacter pfennigii]KPU44709.1 hypothetical protein OXPF_17950 [Oxobacter pfennigii]
MALFSDKKVILGMGIGFVLASLIMMAAPKPKISDDELIRLAREKGMVFQDEIKALYNK